MGRKVLLLETDEQLRALVAPLLEARDFQVTQESSGHNALEMIAAEAPDLVMVGETLEDIDGIGFIIRLRQKEKDLKVVFLSQSWRDAEFFQMITKELKVAHIFHRPIKSSVFGVQVDALWHDQRRGLPHVQGQSPEPIPEPMGMVQEPVAAVPGSGTIPWPAPGTAANYHFPGLQNAQNQGGTAPGAGVPMPGQMQGQPMQGGLDPQRQSGNYQMPGQQGQMQGQQMRPRPAQRQTGTYVMPGQGGPMQGQPMQGPGGPMQGPGGPMQGPGGPMQNPDGRQNTGTYPMPGPQGPMQGQPMQGQPMPGPDGRHQTGNYAMPGPGGQQGPSRQTGNYQMPVPQGPMQGGMYQGQPIQYMGGPMPVPGGAPPLPGMPGGGPSAASMNAFADATLMNFRQRFSKSLPARLKAIEEIIEKVNRAQPDPNLIIEGRRLSHNLKGTSKSCGFDLLGNLAERMENSLRDMLEVANVNHELEWSHVDTALHEAKKEVDAVKMQFSDYLPTAEELANLNPNAAKAKVLVVSADPDLDTALPTDVKIGTNGGIPLEIIRAEVYSEVLERASRQNLDAALIEITDETRDAAFQLARELRSIVGYETLPLGFISKNDEGDRAEAAHAGASLFLEKPFTPQSLQESLQHLITIREGGRSRVLIVDDDPDFTDLITSTLGNEGMLVKALNDPKNVLEVLEEFTPDLMLLDVMMPGILGFDVCKKVRANGRWLDLPIIFLTAQTDLASRLSAFDSGGDDYLPKPVINVELLKRVKVRLDRARMQRERQDRDLLTGLLLRRAFSDHIEALVSESERHGFSFSLCLMDVDHFKKVNDSYGHMAGDRVLAYIGNLLRKRFRVEDLRGRWGGEEFILAFRHERKDTMNKALSRVLEELKKVEFTGDKGETFFTAFSAGMVNFPEDGTNLHDLVLNADRRLYLAKHNGRSQIVMEG